MLTADHARGCACGSCSRSPQVAQPGPSVAEPGIASDTAFSGGMMTQLQQTIGNAAVSGLMRRPAFAGAMLARRGFFGGAESEQERYDDAIEEKQDFISGGLKGPEDYRASTGIGGFNVSYSPASHAMNVLLRGAVNFVNGMELVDGSAVATQPKAGDAANAINAMPAAQRAAAVADWQWTDGKDTFMEKFESVVMGVWSAQHEFVCAKPYWEDLGATPAVNALIHEGAKTDEDHMAMTVYKVPANFTGTVGVVNSPAATWYDDGSTDNTMTLNSTDVDERTDNVLDTSIDFDPETATLKDAATVGMLAIRFKTGGPICKTCHEPISELGGVGINVTAHGDGADPEAMAKSRFDAISAAFVAGGMTDAPTRLQYNYGGAGTVAAMKVGDGVAQIVAAHEAGHMFGLGDRYATTPGGGIGGTGPSAGLPSKHDQIAQNEGLGEAKASNDDGIMSWGNDVRPADYATFLEALKDVTGIDWALGAPRPVLAPGATDPGTNGPGDFPTPAANPDTGVG
jgi:hypothetical protein